MRIAIIGKGGSGKTTVTSLLSTYFSQKNKNRDMIVIDADLNSHLNDALEIEFNKQSIGDRVEELRELLHNNRKDIQKDKMVGTTCPNQESKLITLNSSDEILNKFFVKKDNIFFTKVGSYSKEDIGSNCYHSKLESLELFLHHYLDKKEDITFIDSTAGVDILGTSLFMSYDYLFFVVEPTLKSVQVFKDFISKFKDENYSNTNICIIGNKIIDKTDSKFIEEQLKSQVSEFFYIPFSNLFRRIEKGEKINLQEITNELDEELDLIYTYINENYNKNWNEYKQKLIKLHNKISQDWYNDYYGEDITKLDIESFTYEKQINN